MCRKMLILRHILFYPFFALNSRNVPIMRKSEVFWAYKTSPRYLDGTFVRNFQLFVNYGIMASFSQTHEIEAARVPALSIAFSG